MVADARVAMQREFAAISVTAEKWVRPYRKHPKPYHPNPISSERTSTHTGQVKNDVPKGTLLSGEVALQSCCCVGRWGMLAEFSVVRVFVLMLLPSQLTTPARLTLLLLHEGLQSRQPDSSCFWPP